MKTLHEQGNKAWCTHIAKNVSSTEACALLSHWTSLTKYTFKDKNIKHLKTFSAEQQQQSGKKQKKTQVYGFSKPGS